MKKLFLVLMVALIMVTGVNANTNSSGNLNLLVGQKNLDDDDWVSDEQTEFGFSADINSSDRSVSFVFGVLRSFDDEEYDGYDSYEETEVSTTELFVGARKIFNPGSSVRFYLGGGLAYIMAEISAEGYFHYDSYYDGYERFDFDIDEDDANIGFWADTGMYFDILPKFTLGLNLRYSKAEVSLFDYDYEAGGLHYGLTASYRF